MSKIRLYGATSGYVDLAAPAVADDATLTLPTGATGFGKVLQVVQTTKTDTYTTTSTSFGTVTGLTASITPTSSSSKVLIMVQLSFSLGGGTFNDAYGHFKVTRGGTDIYRGDAAGSRVRAVFGGQNRTDAPNATVGGSIVYLDSPATTSSTTYQVESRAATSNGGVYINRGVSDSDADVATRAASSITLMEIGA